MPIPAHARLADETFEGIDLAGDEIRDAEFLDCRFLQCNLAGATLAECRLASSSFEKCDLSLVTIPETRFTDVRFVDCKMIGIDWTRANWPRVTVGDPIEFLRSMIDQSVFLGLELPKIRIRDCSAREADFREADLTAANFAGTDLTGSLFSNTKLGGADLSRALNYAIAPLENDVRKAKFSLPEALALLECLGIELVYDDDDED